MCALDQRITAVLAWLDHVERGIPPSLGHTHKVAILHTVQPGTEATYVVQRAERRGHVKIDDSIERVARQFLRPQQSVTDCRHLAGIIAGKFFRPFDADDLEVPVYIRL